jgi:alkylation response protein AidB-like acyl-CoA dehydrogenase
MRRTLFEPEHDQFRESFRRWVRREITPHLEEWDAAGIVPRELFQSAGHHGFLGLAVPVDYGGAGIDDFRFNVIMQEEIQFAGAHAAGSGMTLHNDICLPYFLRLTNDEQKRRWLPGIVSGDLITAVAMTEPGAGSDLAGITTSATRNGQGYNVKGTKTFITNGVNSDLVITAVRTGAERHRGLSLVVIERGMPGFERGRRLAKLGQHAQDTAELFFDNLQVPFENRLGQEGTGFTHLMENLAQERLSIAAASVSAAQQCLEWTLQYVTNRKAFGKTIGSFQNSRFLLAELKTQVEVAQAFFDRCLAALLAGELTAAEAAMAKLWCSEVQNHVVDRCLQLHGGYGYMTEYPIARAFVDARASTIYGGTSEVMKEIIGRSMGL